MSTLEVTLEGVDIVSSVTQATINDQFAGLAKLKIIPDHLEIVLPRRLGTLKAQLLPPTVILGLEKAPRQLLFFLNFSSGSFDTFDDDGKPKNVPFGAGTFAFDVNIDLTHIDLDKVPPHIREALRNSVPDSAKNLGEGMFSMRQLFLDFNNASLANYDVAHTTLPPVLRDDVLFVTGLTMYMKRLHENSGNILGYGITVKNPNEVAPEAPTFPPTDLNFATKIYVDPATKARDPKLDTLNYLMMTQHRPLPDAVPKGNLVEESAQGTMAISRAVFTEGYLLPLLAKITNRTSTFCYLYWSSAGLNTTAGGAFRPCIGDSGYDAAAKEVPGLVDNVIWNYVTVTEGILGVPDGTSSSQPISGWLFSSLGGKQTIEHDTPIGGSNTALTGIVHHMCELKIPPGGNEIMLRGTSTVGTSWDTYAGIALAPFTMHTLHATRSTLNWHAKIKLKADSAGRIVAETEFGSDPVQTVPSSNWIGQIDDWAYPDQAISAIRDMEYALSTTISSDQLSKGLAGVLTRNNTFVFPGGQQYFFKDLVFNNNLDLLATLTIKFY